MSRIGIQKTVIDFVEPAKLRWLDREDGNSIQVALFLDPLESQERRSEGENGKTKTDRSRRTLLQTLALYDSGVSRPPV